jgi:excisionase family DNA binding protein
MRNFTSSDAAVGDGVQLLTIREVLIRLKVSRSTFYQLVKNQEIALRKIGGASRIRSDELDAYVQALPRLQTPIDGNQ